MVDYKKKRKFNKEDAIYGIFKGYDEGDDDEGSSMTAQGEVRYSKLSNPIGFISSGVYEINEEMKDTSKKEKNDDNGNDLHDKNNEYDSDQDDIDKKKVDKKKKKKKKQKVIDDGMPPTAATTNKVYKGIGLSILSKMGYTGGGLGVQGSGLVEPIKAFVRADISSGLSYYKEGTQITEPKVEDDEDESDEDESEEELETSKKRNTKNWKKKSSKMDYDLDNYLTEEDKRKDREKKLKNITTQSNSQQQPQLIIDMRGQEARLYTGLDDINSNTKSKGEILSELKHNMDLLVNLKIIDIQNTDSKIKFENSKIQSTQSQIEKIQSTIQSNNNRSLHIKEIKEMISQCQDAMTENKLTLKSLFKSFYLLYHKFPEEYQQFKLYYLEKDLLRPLLTKEFSNYNFCNGGNDYNSIPQSLFSWKELLDPINIHDNNVNTQQLPRNHIYFKLCRDLILPILKDLLKSKWNVKEQSKECVLSVNEWFKVLPETIGQVLLDQVILPKLTREIENWNPREDTIPISDWVIPWLPMLKEHLTSYFPTIRQKIIPLLVHDWDPLDESALDLLMPWNGVFEGNTMEALLRKAILPKLSKSIEDFQINPSQQSSIEPVTVLFKWIDLIKLPVLVEILERNLFRKFQTTLLQWLKNPDADFKEISNWYQGWKSQFPEQLLQYHRIKNQFTVSLNLMKKAMAGDQSLFDIKIDNLMLTIQNMNNNNNTNQETQKQPIQSIIQNISQQKLSIRQVLEQLAMSNGILFLPTQRMNENGQQIYTFGKSSITIERDLIYHQVNTRWEPANIQTLIENNIVK